LAGDGGRLDPYFGIQTRVGELWPDAPQILGISPGRSTIENRLNVLLAILKNVPVRTSNRGRPVAQRATKWSIFDQCGFRSANLQPFIGTFRP